MSVMGVERDKKYKQETLAKAVRINCAANSREDRLLVIKIFPTGIANAESGVFEKLIIMAMVLKNKKISGIRISLI